MPHTAAVLAFIAAALPLSAQKPEIPKNIAESVGAMLGYSQQNLLDLAEAMPEQKYSFIPANGEFSGARSFGEQVKHVACAHLAFFNEIEGKAPPELCEKGGPSPRGARARSSRICAPRSSMATACCAASLPQMRSTAWKAVMPPRTRNSASQPPLSGTSPTITGSS